MDNKNSAWYQRLRAVECQDSTMSLSEDFLVLQEGQGSILRDVEGRSFIDLCAGFGALTHGHIDITAWTQNLKEDGLVQGMGDVYPSASKVKLLETIKSLLPPHLEKGALAVTGSQAVELALKTACLATGGNNFLCFQNGYHGLDIGVLPVTDGDHFRKPFESLLPHGRGFHLPYGCSIELLEKSYSDNSLKYGRIAAVLVEPIQGRGGIILPPPEWLMSLRHFCDKKNLLLIFDEVFTGLGRIGTMTSSFDVPCDITCLGKALGGGMPVSACFGTKEVMSSWPMNTGEAIHTGTFFGHALSCSVANKNLEFLVAQGLAERSASLGLKGLFFLKNSLLATSFVKDIRGKGLMIVIEMHESNQGVVLMNTLKRKGIIAIPSGPKGQCLSITPALNIPEPLFFEALETICGIIQSW
ncbi:MAG: aspartate aminotransferase family protein [Zetaproteobacteria bacterium]|nr:aspartate aminotransferase family protein [Pseudobdellovibrionaceae bacterium]|tara:strand:+ start:944 stop:2185 length:1242 start_codon:yes stop_codon:yes gene_type:complete